jgi:O-antigen biosynthesis protein WbqP
MIKRIFDLMLSFFLLLICVIPIMLIAAVIKMTSKGPAIHWSKRVGKNNKIFLMPKFRSMTIDTPQVATHLLTTSQNYVTRVGAFLRKTSLDELPQLWSVLVGDMSFVGPRPALFNQDDLVALRSQYGIERLRPGITGWAQVNGRDELSIPVKVQFDKEYLESQSFFFDVKIIFLTFVKVFMAEGIRH